MLHGYQCGMIWGATLAAGAQAYRRFGSGPKAEVAAIVAAQRLVEAFRTGNKHINCLEITELDKSSTALQMIIYYIVKGGTIGCMRRAARYAPVALREIEIAMAEDQTVPPTRSVSCAAQVARKMGADDQQTVMAAGFAGGIGLCGGACGALGAAVWMLAMGSSKKQDGKVEFKDSRAQAAIERFIKTTGCKFECTEIVGRKFKDIEDHASHVSGGGCEDIIEVLVGD